MNEEQGQHSDVTKVPKNDFLSEVFHIGLVWRIIYGTSKVLLGIALLHFHGLAFLDIFHRIMEHEILEDRNDFILRIGDPLLRHASLSVTYFLASYIIFWGALDAILSFWLLRQKQWAYPAASALMGFFILYQVLRFTHTHSPILLFVTCVDVGLLFLTVREYRKKFFQRTTL